jgi:two-component system, NarL family, sensor histidine kinase BarA
MLRFLQNVFASMSLERKCLLFFGSALLLLMLGAFWILQVLAGQLVTHQTRQMAAKEGRTQLVLSHVKESYRLQMQSTPERLLEAEEVLGSLVPVLMHQTSTTDVLSLPGESEFDNLPATEGELEPQDLEVLENLRDGFEQWMRTAIQDQLLSKTGELEMREAEPFVQVAVNSQPLFVGRGPISDRYYYYEPIVFNDLCMKCHAKIGVAPISIAQANPETVASDYPFRVIKVSVPYQSIYETNTAIRALLIAIAMMIIAVGLYVLHAIVRYLVLRPLYHLRDVSDAISRGDTALRASIETEDEFRELGDAFNRMLRHLTETQDQIREVNRELDQRVDQLAQLNLQLYEANRLKSDFLANMSHELRTPLNSIIGFSDVLQGIESLNDKQRRYAANIQRSGRVLLEMINDILDLAKVEAGKMEVRRSTFNIASLVRSQVDMVRGLSDDKNLSLKVHADEDLPLIEQDQSKIGQILTNLLSNAIKFTPEGGMINVTVKDLVNGRLCISVADTGIGIAEEDQGVIFEKFRQSRRVLDGDGLTREFSGTGLGLSIVKELSKLLGGEIKFVSQLGQGSTFHVTLPWCLPSEPLSPTGSATLEMIQQ